MQHQVRHGISHEDEKKEVINNALTDKRCYKKYSKKRKQVAKIKEKKIGYKLCNGSVQKP